MGMRSRCGHENGVTKKQRTLFNTVKVTSNFEVLP